MPRSLYPRQKSLYPLQRRLEGRGSRSSLVQKISSATGFELRTVQLVGHYNEHYARRKLRKNEDEYIIGVNNKNKNTIFVQA